jgi:hypothetical protein
MNRTFGSISSGKTYDVHPSLNGNALLQFMRPHPSVVSQQNSEKSALDGGVAIPIPLNAPIVATGNPITPLVAPTTTPSAALRGDPLGVPKSNQAANGLRDSA